MRAWTVGTSTIVAGIGVFLLSFDWGKAAEKKGGAPKGAPKPAGGMPMPPPSGPGMVPGIVPSAPSEPPPPPPPPSDSSEGDQSSTDSCKGEPDETMMCTAEYSPVCGCDGKTYSNGCYAERAGIKEYTEGACEGDEKTRTKKEAELKEGSLKKAPAKEVQNGTEEDVRPVVEEEQKRILKNFEGFQFSCI